MGNCPTLLGPGILAAMHSQSTLFKLDAVLGGARYIPGFITLEEAD
jgi:hypothetical protein